MFLFIMNNKEAIVFLGEKEGSRLRISYSIEDINKAIPYFRLKKTDSGDYYMMGHNYLSHDNAERMNFFLSYLKQFVIPNVSKSTDLTGYYNIELHDSNSYLVNDHDYNNCLVWSRNKNDRNPILLPDIYQMTNYDNKLATKDHLEWHAKTNQIAFFGTTTGDMDPSKNARLQWCAWRAQQMSKSCDYYITKVAQMSVENIINAYGENLWQKMYRAYVPHTELHKYKFSLDIPGNTASWDRVPVVLNSKSLLFKAPCTDMCFYYPLLRKGDHYIDVPTPDDAVRQQQYYLSNDSDCKRIITNANNFVRDFLTPNAAIRYMVALFETSHYFSGK